MTDRDRSMGGFNVQVQHWMPESVTRPLISAARREYAGRSAPSERQIDEIKARVRREGVAYHSGKRTPTIAAISAPVFSHDGRLAGALTSIGLVGQFDETPDSPVAKALIGHTTALSRSLGVRKAP